MKRNLLLLIGVFVCAYSYGQGEIDALRFSRNDLVGTARGQAMGGAFGALGGDITGIAINPAGVAVYRTSELSGTLGLNFGNIETNWQNSINKKRNTNFDLDNLSYVGYYPMGDDDLQSINFGFSYNKLKNFNRDYTASGSKMASSLTDYMANITNGFNEDDLDFKYYDVPWLSVLGWETGLINPNPSRNEHYIPCLIEGESVSPQLNVSERGHIDSYDFTLGANFSNSFYAGMTFSYTDVYYRMDSRYGEDFEKGGGFTLDNYLQTEGAGYQLNVGAIWRPADFLRIGVAYHSPTWYVLRDYFSATATPIGLEWENGQKISPLSTPDGDVQYRFQTPSGWVFSLAGVLGSKTIISVDYEIKDYTGMNLDGMQGDDYSYNNEDIDQHFKIASTVRAGLEYRFTPQFSGRLGYSRVENPYEKKVKNNKTEIFTVRTIPHYTLEGDAQYFTAGIGYRFTSNLIPPYFYLDAAFVYRTQKDDLYFHPSILDGNDFILESKSASFNNVSCKGLITLGYKF